MYLRYVIIPEERCAIMQNLFYISRARLLKSSRYGREVYFINNDQINMRWREIMIFLQ